MGAYLSSPITDKEYSSEENEFLTVVSCSMQGWRSKQEDAHNAILDFDKDSSFFAVYDGHGGDEVAKYCAQYLPNFIKKNEAYINGEIKEALTSSFLKFDETLIEEAVVAELKKIAGVSTNQEDDDSDPAEAFDLQEEADMPIEEVVAKYGKGEGIQEDGDGSATEPVDKGESSSGSSMSQTPKNPALSRVARTQKIISPFLRSKRPPFDSVSTDDGEVKKELDDSEPEAKHSNGNSVEEKSIKVEESSVKVEEEEAPTNGNGTVLKNGHNDDKTEVKASAEHMNGDEKEVVSVKGKGKGKGKSSMAKQTPVDPEVKKEEDDEDLGVVISAKKKTPKSGKELYQKILVADSDGDDEDLDDEDDENFGDEKHQNDDDDDDDDSDEYEDMESGEEEEDDEDDDEEDSEDDEDDDEDSINAAGMMAGNFTEEPGNDSGCTAVVALVRGNTLFVANAGDSRCIVCREGKAIDMSEDHKPEDPPEMERIRKAGGQVTSDGRVNGGLNLSRAIGDHAYKTNKSLPLAEQMISPVPDIKTLTLNPELDSFVFLACDGIWNSLSSQEVVDFINARLESHDPTQERLKFICEELFDHCLAPDTLGDGTGCDNMTAVLVKLKPTFASQSHATKRKPEEEETTTSKKQKLDEETEAAVASLNPTEEAPNSAAETVESSH